MAEQLSGRAHQVTSLILSCVGVAGSLASWRMGLWTMGSPDAGLLPFMASMLLAGLAGAAIFLRAPDPLPVDPCAWRRLAGYGASMLLLCIGPLVVGCLAGFSAALFLAMRVSEKLPVRTALLWSIGLSVSSVLVFRLLLGVPLPDPLIDRLLGL